MYISLSLYIYICIYIYIYIYTFNCMLSDWFPFLDKRRAPTCKFNWPNSHHQVHSTYTPKHTTTCHGSCQGQLLVGACAHQCMFGSIWTLNTQSEKVARSIGLAQQGDTAQTFTHRLQGKEFTGTTLHQLRSTANTASFVLWVFRRVKVHHNSPPSSSFLKNTCVWQVVSDECFPLSLCQTYELCNAFRARRVSTSNHIMFTPERAGARTSARRARVCWEGSSLVSLPQHAAAQYGRAPKCPLPKLDRCIGVCIGYASGYAWSDQPLCHTE